MIFRRQKSSKKSLQSSCIAFPTFETLEKSDNNEFRIDQTNIGYLNGYEGEVNIWNLSIPQQADNFKDFCLR